MSGSQTDHDRARIIEAHDTIAQEAHWGGEPDKDDDQEPELNEYEQLIKAAAQPLTLFRHLPDDKRREIVLAWLACAEADSVRDYVLDAVGLINARNLSEYLVNVMRGTDKGQFGELLVGYLEIALASFIDRDIKAWRKQQ